MGVQSSGGRPRTGRRPRPRPRPRRPGSQARETLPANQVRPFELSSQRSAICGKCLQLFQRTFYTVSTAAEALFFYYFLRRSASDSGLVTGGRTPARIPGGLAMPGWWPALIGFAERWNAHHVSNQGRTAEGLCKRSSYFQIRSKLLLVMIMTGTYEVDGVLSTSATSSGESQH